jgi:hypothetical protein
VPDKGLSVLLCIYRMLASIMLEFEYGSLCILGHTLRNINPLVGNQGESKMGSTEGFERKQDLRILT